MKLQLPAILSLALCFAAPGFSQEWVQEGLTLSKAFQLRSLIFDDVDGDGIRDLISHGGAGAGNDLQIYIYWGLPGGQYSDVQRMTDATNGRVTRLVAIDVDDDGVSEYLGQAIGGTVVYLFRPGAGRSAWSSEVFVDPDEFPTAGAERLQVVDLDGDGDDDVVFRWRAPGAPETAVAWMERVGPGQFNGPQAVTAPGTDIGSSFVCDVDGDGDLDVAAAVVSPAGFAWFRNDGGPLLTGPIWIEQAMDLASVRAIEPVDLNQDGLLDFVTAGTPGGTVVSPTEFSLFSATGAGAFGPRQALGSVSGLLRTIGFGDLAGIGRRDIVVATYTGTLMALPDDGAGGYGAAVEIVPAPRVPEIVLLEDADGDGRDDIFLIGETPVPSSLGVSFLGLLQSTSTAGVPSVGIPQIIEEQNGIVEEPAMGDVNGDGVLDFVASVSNEGRLLVILSAGDVPSRRRSSIDLPLAGSRSLELADLDGDGLLDIVTFDTAGTGELLWLANPGGAGQWVPSTLQGTTSGAGGLAATDFDLDGDVDVLLTVHVGGTSQRLRYYENLGAGSFAAGVTLFTQATGAREVRDFHVGDLTGNGLLDIAYIRGSTSAGSQIVWARRQAGGGMSAPTALVSVPGQLFSGVRGIAVGDVDQDGDDDLIGGFNNGNGQLVLYRATGGNLVPTQIESFGGFAGPRLVELADGDLDGDLDILITGDFVGGDLAYYENTGGGTYPGRRPVSELSAGRLLTSIGDIDADGDPDVLATDGANGISYIYRCDFIAPIGEAYCPAVANSTGRPSRASASGSILAANSLLTLRVHDLPPNVFGIFATSQTQAVVTSIPNSIGTLCLGGMVGRFVGPGQVVGSGGAGTFELNVDLSALPQGQGTVAAVAGETWNFQAWHRDVDLGTATSNFSEALSIQWQ